MKKTVFYLIAFALITLSMSNNSGRGFSYQAVARTLDGEVKANEEIELRFSLYPGQQAAAPSWQEVHTTTTNPFGVFSVIIGKGTKSGGDANTFADVNFALADYWLKVEVNDDGIWQEISNNQLHSSPYAEVAHNAQSTPVGTILIFSGPKEKVPDGWLLCDGSTLNRAEHAGLYNVIGTAWGHGDGVNTFNIPDLRGLFVRGVDGGRGMDSEKNNRAFMRPGGNTNNNVGSLQLENIKKHRHTASISEEGRHRHKVYTNKNSDHTTLDAGDESGDKSEFAWSEYAGQHSHTFSMQLNDCVGCGNETRPDNAYVNYIIKI